MIRWLLVLAASLLALAPPAGAAPAGVAPATAVADDPSCPAEHAEMGHCTPAPSTPVASPAAADDPNCPPEHAAMGHCTPVAAPPAPADDPSCPPEHAAMGHCMPARATGAPPVAPPPAAALAGPEHAADTIWDPALMAEKRQVELIDMHGGFSGSKLLIDRLEAQLRDGHDGFAWEGEGWFGGDYDRLWLKSEGEGAFGEAVEHAELQALYSRAIDPWFNLQAGVRYDLRPRPDRAHLVVGVQGLAPYWFEIDGALFLSDAGDLTVRFEAEYDQRITNRLILQPSAEVELAAQDVPELGIGAGLSSLEAGLRLRYEFVPEFAPYVGVEYQRRLGDTADFARAAGEGVGGWSLLAGLRAWF